MHRIIRRARRRLGFWILGWDPTPKPCKLHGFHHRGQRQCAQELKEMATWSASAANSHQVQAD